MNSYKKINKKHLLLYRIYLKKKKNRGWHLNPTCTLQHPFSLQAIASNKKKRKKKSILSLIQKSQKLSQTMGKNTSQTSRRQGEVFGLLFFRSFLLVWGSLSKTPQLLESTRPFFVASLSSQRQNGGLTTYNNRLSNDSWKNVELIFWDSG